MNYCNSKDGERIKEKWNGETYYAYPNHTDKSRWYFRKAYKIKEGDKYKTILKFLHKEKYEHYHGKVEKGFHVHHIDGNRRNNDLDNLIALSHSDHIKLHAQQEMRDYICSECGASFHGIQKTDTILCVECRKKKHNKCAMEWHKDKDNNFNEYRRKWYAENKHEINKKRRERDRRNRKEKKAKGDIDSILNFL
jgi:protein-arginine kinase activator protein McsA